LPCPHIHLVSSFYVKMLTEREKDGETERQTDSQTDRETENRDT